MTSGLVLRVLGLLTFGEGERCSRSVSSTFNSEIMTAMIACHRGRDDTDLLSARTRFWYETQVREHVENRPLQSYTIVVPRHRHLRLTHFRHAS